LKWEGLTKQWAGTKDPKVLILETGSRNLGQKDKIPFLLISITLSILLPGSFSQEARESFFNVNQIFRAI